MTSRRVFTCGRGQRGGPPPGQATIAAPPPPPGAAARPAARGSIGRARAAGVRARPARRVAGWRRTRRATSLRSAAGWTAPIAASADGSQRGGACEERGERGGVGGRKRPAVFALGHEVVRAAAPRRHQHGQPGGHRLVDHQAPRLLRAGMDERPGQPVIGGQFRVLLEAGQGNVRPSRSSAARWASRAGRNAPSPSNTSFHALGSGRPAVGGVGIEQTGQVFLRHEAVGRQEITRGQPEPGAGGVPVGAGRRRAPGEMVVVHGVVTGENPSARHAQFGEVRGVRFAADQPGGTPPHDLRLDPFLPGAARFVEGRALGHDHGGHAVASSPTQRRQRRRVAPAGDHHGGGAFAVEQHFQPSGDGPGRLRRAFAPAEQRGAAETPGAFPGDCVPGVFARFGGLLDAQHVAHPRRRGEPGAMVGAEPMEDDGDAFPAVGVAHDSGSSLPTAGATACKAATAGRGADTRPER